jgi:DNA-binding transcriptional ArsR family regulator
LHISQYKILLLYNYLTMPTKSAKVENETEKAWAEVFGVLSDSTRLRMFLYIVKKEGLCTTELSREFGVSLPIASYHLKILENADLVRKERSGQMICYYAMVNNASAQKVAHLLLN